MDTTTWIIIGGLTFAALLMTVVMLYRSWGDFPGPTGGIPPSGPSAPGTSDWRDVVDESPWPGTFESGPPLTSRFAGTVPAGLVRIEHPMVRRAAEEVLRRGDVRTARYFVRDGGAIYFNANAIPDPDERRQAYELMRRLEAREHVDLKEVLRLVQRLSQA